MKKRLLILLLCFVTSSASFAQEWLTSFHLAKRLALTKGKMILAIWEDTASYDYPIILEDQNGKHRVLDLFENDEIKSLVWEFFVPVIIQESKYEELSKDVIGKRSYLYEQRFNDDFLKVMDPNGNILNVSVQDEFAGVNLSAIFKKYAVDTSFLKAELNNYAENKTFSTTFRLYLKYVDVALYSDVVLKKEMIKLSEIYKEEAEALLVTSDFENKEALKQKLEFLEIKQQLILGKPKKAFRWLKKIDTETIDDINKSLFSFLNYATFTALNKIDQALQWKDKVSAADLKKVKFIIK